jgi:hypothetical protein
MPNFVSITDLFAPIATAAQLKKLEKSELGGLSVFVFADASEEAEEEEAEEEEAEEEEDLEVLGEAADEDDKAAQKRLTALAKEAEVDPNDYDTWAELAEYLGSEEEEAEEESEDDDDWE